MYEFNRDPRIRIRGFPKGFFVILFMLVGAILTFIIELFYEPYLSKEFITLLIFIPSQILGLLLLLSDFDSIRSGSIIIIGVITISAFLVVMLWKGIGFWYKFDLPDSIGVNKAFLLIMIAIYMSMALGYWASRLFKYIEVTHNQITIRSGLFAKKHTFPTQQMAYMLRDDKDVFITLTFRVAYLQIVYPGLHKKEDKDVGYIFKPKKVELILQYLLSRTQVDVDDPGNEFAIND